MGLGKTDPILPAIQRSDVNFMTLQYFINYNFPSFYLSSAPIITANWEAPSGQEWTVPVGIGIGKVTSLGKVPTNVSGQYYYNAVTPDYGAEWTLRLQIQFLVPKWRRSRTGSHGLKYGE